MNDGFERFDMKKPPVRCRQLLKPVIWAACIPGLIRHRTKITKIGLKGLKPPYLLLGNHNAFFDMNVSAMSTFPHFGNYVVAIDGFIGREWLLRQIGCICKRKFTSDLQMIRHLQTVIKEKGIAAIYPEARYSLCGTATELPESVGKLCRMLKVPVVSLICHGHHINHPFWNTSHERKVKPTKAEMKLLFSVEELETLTLKDINERLMQTFQYDDFRWQKENRIRVDDPKRADYLDKILYQCPHCGTEFRMKGQGTQLSCKACGKTWEMTEYGELKAFSGETEFSHIPDWYEWERENVKQEVMEGRYSSGLLQVSVESLPNAKGFIKLGKGTMIHDMQGFRVSVTSDEGQTYEMVKDPSSMEGCHVEYNYLFKHGDCVDLNTLEDTWYTYPEGEDFSVTKMALATEELHRKYAKERKQAVPGTGRA